MLDFVFIMYVQLLRHQPNVNLINEHGNTPLHYAAFWNYIGISEVSKHCHKPLSQTCNLSWCFLLPPYPLLFILLSHFLFFALSIYFHFLHPLPLYFSSLLHIYSLQVLVKNGAVIALSNKFGQSPYTRARPTLKRKFQCWYSDEV